MTKMRNVHFHQVLVSKASPSVKQPRPDKNFKNLGHFIESMSFPGQQLWQVLYGHQSVDIGVFGMPELAIRYVLVSREGEQSLILQLVGIPLTQKLIPFKPRTPPRRTNPGTSGCMTYFVCYSCSLHIIRKDLTCSLTYGLIIAQPPGHKTFLHSLDKTLQGSPKKTRSEFKIKTQKSLFKLWAETNLVQSASKAKKNNKL